MPAGHRTILVALISLVAATGAAAWTDVAGGAPKSAPIWVDAGWDGGVKEIRLRVPGLEITPVRTADGTMVSVSIPGGVSLLEAGAPELPLLARAVALPDRGRVSLEVVEATWTTVDTRAPLPSRGALARGSDPEQVPRVAGPVYAGTTVWPATAAEMSRPFLVRDQRGVSLRVHPVRWDAGRRELQALVSLTVRLVVDGTAGINEATRPVSAAPRAFGPVLARVFGDSFAGVADRSDKGLGYGQSERMLMVTSPDLATTVAEFATWKRQSGHLVEVLTMDAVGGSVLGLMDAIRARYESEAGLAYVLLVGDVAQVPTRTGSYHGADSDGMYGLLAGDDLFVDVLVSRLPARNGSEARVMIDRIIGYERDVQAGADWCGRSVGIASDEGSPADWERADWLREDLLSAGQVEIDRVYQGFGGDRTDIAAALNHGVGLVNYLGHGSSTAWLSVPFGNADVHALANTSAWPWIIDVSCSNGDFSLDECFAEAWLRATHDGQPAGAVAMISASTEASWVPPTVMQATMLDELTQTGERELGALYAAGVAEVLVQYAGLGQDRKLMEQYNLFGDASMQVRMLAPTEQSISHASNLAAGVTAWTLRGPVGARVVLTAGDERLARVVVPAEGTLQIVPARALVEGEVVTLTVLADQRVTYQTSLPVGAAVTAIVGDAPAATALHGNYPNPFNPQTTVAFAIDAPGPVRLSILDVRGRLVTTLIDQDLPAGEHQARWNGRDASGRPVGAGVYLARLDHGGQSQARSLTMVK